MEVYDSFKYSLKICLLWSTVVKSGIKVISTSVLKSDSSKTEKQNSRNKLIRSRYHSNDGVDIEILEVLPVFLSFSTNGLSTFLIFLIFICSLLSLIFIGKVIYKKFICQYYNMKPKATSSDFIYFS